MQSVSATQQMSQSVGLDALCPDVPRPSKHKAAADLVGACQAAVLADLGDALQAAALKALHKVAPAGGALHGAGPVMGAGGHH